MSIRYVRLSWCSSLPLKSYFTFLFLGNLKTYSHYDRGCFMIESIIKMQKSIFGYSYSVTYLSLLVWLSVALNKYSICQENNCVNCYTNDDYGYISFTH